MSIYERKNAKGQPTGLYVLELTMRGVKHKESSRDLASLQARQAAIVAGVIPAGPSLPPTAFLGASRPYTVGDLRRDALVVWKGTKDRDQSVQRFEATCDILGANTPLADIEMAELDKVVAALEDRGLANKTIHRYLSAFSAATFWAVGRKHIRRRPDFPWPKCGKGNDTVVKPEDEVRMLTRLQKSGARDMALIWEVLMATGARIGEVLKLEPDLIDRKEGGVRFPDTKNDDDRTVYIEPALAVRLHALATVGMPSYRRVNTAFHRARKHLKLEYKVTPHVLRHTVGTRLDELGVSVKQIGTQLGHKSERTTLGYIHPQKAVLKKVGLLLSKPPGNHPSTPKHGGDHGGNGE